jgi:hypothetical protein
MDIGGADESGRGWMPRPIRPGMGQADDSGHRNPHDAAHMLEPGTTTSECGPRRAGCGSGAMPGHKGGHDARPGAGRIASDGASTSEGPAV